MRIISSKEFNPIKTKRLTADKRKDLLTYILFIAWPILQFAIFYVGVNGNALLLTFQENVTGAQFTFSSEPFKNLGLAFRDFFGPKFAPYLTGSLIMFSLTTVIGVPLALFFSFYIYKKLPLSGFFRVALFLPSIISATVLAIMFKYFSNYALPRLVTLIFGAEALPEGFTGYFSEKPFQVVLFFNIFISFGTSVLMYSNKMASIDPSLNEAAKIDGASPTREFFSVVLPHVYPTFVIFFVTGIGTLFINQYNVMTFFGWNADSNMTIFGYKLFAEAAKGDYTVYPYLSSLGLVVSIIVIPITLILRKVLFKYGPSEK